MRLLGGFVVLWLLVRPAAAEDGAREYFDRGTALFALGKYGEAATNYEKCFELKPDPAILYNAAQAHRLAGNKGRALELYQNYVRIYRTRVQNVAEVQRHIDNLRAAMAVDRRASTTPPITTRSPSGDPSPGRSAEPPRSPPPPGEPKTSPRTPTAAPPEPQRNTQLVVATPPPEKPLVKRPWFWAVVAGAVVVVGTSVALGVVFGNPGSVDPGHSFGTVKAN